MKPAQVPELSRSESADERLLLLAQEPDEVAILSALVQSAVLRAIDIAYDQHARRLVLLLNRYRWEADDQTRVQSALRFESVTAVQRRDWPGDAATETVLELLACTFADDAITLSFGGGAALRVTVECVDVVVEDISGPRRASREPRYD